MKSMFLSLFTCVLFAAQLQAQEPKAVLDMQLNKNILQPGDSLKITVTYSGAGALAAKSAMATVEFIIENETGRQTRLRWPFINGRASGVLRLPDSLPPGKYNLMAGLQQRFFEIVGQVKNEKKLNNIQAMLLTKNGNWDEQEVTLAANGSFAIRNWLFEDNALLAFSGSGNKNQPLDIRISTQLDSSSTVVAVTGRSFYIGNPTRAVKQALNDTVEIDEASFTDKGNLLPAVFVRTTIKTPAEQFNDQYISSLFKTGNEKILSIMDDPAAIGSNNILWYLQGRVAGLQITGAGPNGGSASWRGGPVAFFIDEMNVSSQQLLSIPITDIAIVKAYPPPFFGAIGGAAGIAIYTRRGGDRSFLPANRQVFRVKGYTANSAELDMNKLLL